MNELLQNPVYHALLSDDKHFNLGNENVKFFDPEVSPFVGFDEGNTKGFDELYDLLPTDRRILYANPNPIKLPQNWQLQHEINGFQFVYEKGKELKNDFPNIIPLTTNHVKEMVELARLTKPGPFDTRTIEFGSYHGIFENNKLVAMTGQRLHIKNYSEISAVCTHPEHIGKSYAFSLLQHQLQIIMKEEQIPFLHVRDDNTRAIQLYERLGFKVSRPMTFYFMKRSKYTFGNLVIRIITFYAK